MPHELAVLLFRNQDTDLLILPNVRFTQGTSQLSRFDLPLLKENATIRIDFDFRHSCIAHNAMLHTSDRPKRQPHTDKQESQSHKGILRSFSLLLVLLRGRRRRLPVTPVMVAGGRRGRRTALVTAVVMAIMPVVVVMASGDTPAHGCKNQKETDLFHYSFPFPGTMKTPSFGSSTSSPRSKSSA